jgi:hypothetical protein
MRSSLDLCFNVSDVNALGHVHTSNLDGCQNVSDLRALGHVHTLRCNVCQMSVPWTMCICPYAGFEWV